MNDIKTNLNNTIDIKYINAKEYCEQVENKNLIIENMKKILSIAGIIWFIIVSFFGWGVLTPEKSNASYKNELKYYKVYNSKDLARKIRLEVCQKTNTWATREQLLHCWTMNTIVTAIESSNMKSSKCKNDNNCKGLKGWQNGKYWFMKFNSLYEQNIYFSEKFWKFHHKKSLFTFVYWYKQENWEYRYGWTYTQQDTYLEFLTNKYTKVYKELEEIF